VEVFGCRPKRKAIGVVEREGLTYLDTHDTSDERENSGRRRVPPLGKRKKRASLYKLGVEMIAAGRLDEWLKQLNLRVEGAQDYRRQMLAKHQPYALFTALDKKAWYGVLLEKSMRNASTCFNVFSSVGVDVFAVTMLQDTKPFGEPGTLYSKHRL